MYISRRVVDIVCCAEAKYKSILLPNHVQRLDHFSPLSLFLSVSLVAHQQLTKWNKPSYNYQHEYDTFFPLSPPKNAVDCWQKTIHLLPKSSANSIELWTNFFFAFAILQPEKTSLIDAKQRIICLYIERTKETRDKKNWNLCLAMCMWNQTPAQCDEP